MSMLGASASELRVIHPSDLSAQFKEYNQDTDKYEYGLVKSSLGNFGDFTYGT